MPLNLDEVPMEQILSRVAKSYPNLLIIGANEGFAGENMVTDCIFIQGHLLINMGLLKILEHAIMEEWIASKEQADDAP
jgi:hypothetical protein